MACTTGLCTSENIFLFINIAFAMYSGALLATGARLAWDPSTYTWFRFLCAAQYRVSCWYVTAAGVWLLALVYLAAAAAARSTAARSARRAASRSAHRCLHLYSAGVACLALSEVCYGVWMGASLAAWWRDSPRAELARHGMHLVQDLKPALLQFQHYRDVVRPVLDMLEEVEREAPNNVFVIVIFGIVGLILQVAAFAMSWRLSRRADLEPPEKAAAAAACGEDGDESDSPRGSWRSAANLRMYTILDKIF